MTQRFYNSENFDKNDISLTEKQQDVLVGTLLGDANLSTYSVNARTWRYRAIQKKDHKEYLYSKYDTFKNMCGSPSYSTVYDERTQKTYNRFLFNTRTFSKLHPFGQAFYVYNPSTQRWVKDVPGNVASILTPRAVAFWYMDDGSLKYRGHSNAMRICSESFSKQGVELLQAAMWQNFQIDLKLVKRNKNGVLVGYRLAIHETESSKFRELIQPYLVECMKYKVSDGKKGTLADK